MFKNWSIPALVMAAGVVAASPSHAEKVYSTKLLGTVCPSVAEKVVQLGIAKSYYAADHGLLGTGTMEIGYSADTFTVCKVILKYPRQHSIFHVLNQEEVAEWKQDVADREKAIARAMQDECQARSGSIIEGRYSAGADTNHPSYLCKSGGKAVFQARMGELDPYSPGAVSRILLAIAEPKNLDQASGPDFEDFLGGYGFKTPEQVAREQAQQLERQRQDEARARQTAQRLAIERPLKSQIGAKVCRPTGPGSQMDYIGFVESRSPDNGKVQIRIVSTGGFAPGGQGSQIIWDDPDNWSLCRD